MAKAATVRIEYDKPETVWVVFYYTDDNDQDGTLELGGIFEEEMTARFTAGGLILLNHKEAVFIGEVLFDHVLDIETRDWEVGYWATKSLTGNDVVWESVGTRDETKDL